MKTSGAFHILKFIVTLLISWLISGSAYADCTSPAGTEGAIWYDNTPKKVKYCDNTNWITLETTAAGYVLPDGSVPMTGAFLLDFGAEATPGLAFDGDTDTGVYRPAADELGFSTAGAEAIRIDDLGNVGIGAANPDGNLHIMDGSAGAVASSTVADNFTVEYSGAAGGMSFLGPDTSNTYIRFGSPAGNASGEIRYDNTNERMMISTNGSERVRVDENGHVGVGTASPDASAVFDVSSTTKGFLPPRMTTAERDAVTTPAEGLTVFNTTTDKLNVFAGGAWAEAGAGSGGGTGLEYLHLQHREANGTSAGTNVAGAWTKRTLNQIVKNGIAGASHNTGTSVITLPAGTYQWRMTSNFYSTRRTRLRLRDTTGSATIGLSDVAYGNSADVTVRGAGTFTLSTTSTLELQYIALNVQATYGAGLASDYNNELNDGEEEVFTNLVLYKEGTDNTVNSTILSDSDANTKVQVEKNADENIIRFDTAGTERMTIDAVGDVNMTGDLTANSFTGDGAGLSNIGASAIADGSITLADTNFGSTNGINIPQLASDPGSPSAGQIYYNTTTNKMMVYNGSSWTEAGGGSGGGGGGSGGGNEFTSKETWNAQTSAGISFVAVDATNLTGGAIQIKVDGTTETVISPGGKNYGVYNAASSIDVVSVDNGFNLSAVTFDSSFDIAAQDGVPGNIQFNDDGTKMFIVGGLGDDVNEYTLSTAYDVSTASFVDSFSVASQEGAPYGLAFSNDGTKMFVTGIIGDDVNEYTLSTAFDVSTASFVDSFSIAAQDGTPFGLEFNDDGTKMYICGDQNDSIFEYSLSTAFDVSTASFVDSFSVVSQDGIPYDFSFSDSGDKMFVLGAQFDNVYEYTLGTAFDVSTASFVTSYDVSSHDGIPQGLTFNPGGTKMFVVGAGSNDKVFEFNINGSFAGSAVAATGGGGGSDPYGPTFSVTPSSTTNANATYVKVPFNTEQFDTDDAFDTTNNRFQPTKAGYYQINLSVRISMTGTGAFTLVSSLHKNGTAYQVHEQLINYGSTFSQTLTVPVVVYLNGTSDYLEGFFKTNSGTATAGVESRFSGHWLRP